MRIEMSQLDECKGLALRDTVRGHYGQRLLLAFEGDKFCCLAIEHGYERDDEEIVAEGTLDTADFSVPCLEKVGLVTQQEVKEYYEKTAEMRRVEQERLEREQYEALKAKFEPVDQGAE